MHTEHLAHQCGQPVEGNTLYNIEVGRNSPDVSAERNLATAFARLVAFIATSTGTDFLVMAVFGYDGDDDRKVHHLAHIIEFSRHVRQVTATLTAKVAHAVFHDIRRFLHFLEMSIVSGLSAGLQSAFCPQSLRAAYYLVLHTLLRRRNAAVAGVLVRTFILGDAFAQVAVLLLEPVHVALQTDDFSMLRVNGLTH